MDEETGYIVILIAVYITWEMLLTDSNNRVRHRIDTYNVVHDGVPGQAKCSSGYVSLDLSESEDEGRKPRAVSRTIIDVLFLPT